MGVDGGDGRTVLIAIASLPGLTSPPREVHKISPTNLPHLVNMSTALELRLFTALGNLCIEDPAVVGGSSSQSTEV